MFRLLVTFVFFTTVLINSIFAKPGDELWRFAADSVLLIQASSDISAPSNGGQDLIVGSGYDTLYMVEGRGNASGGQLWSIPFLASISATEAIPDISGDGRADVAAGDERGLITMVSGGSGHAFWKYLTFVEGTILSIIHIPDINGDGKEEIVFGSQNDTVYCLSGAINGMTENDAFPKLGQVLWKFSTFDGKVHGKPKIAAAPPSTAIASGANSLSLIHQGNTSYGIAIGSSGGDSLFLIKPDGSSVLWKKQMPGDVWKVKAFPDVDNDGGEEVLIADGADSAYLFSGLTGNLLWSLPVTSGATAIAIAGDINGDGKADAFVGDGNGKVYAVSGAARGHGVTSLWIYDFLDGSTITALAALPDVTGNSFSECVVGTSSNLLTVLNDTGKKSWSVNMGGTVNAVTALAAPADNGFATVVAGTNMGFAAAYQGGDGKPLSIFSVSKSYSSQQKNKRHNLLGQNLGLINTKSKAVGKYFSTSH